MTLETTIEESAYKMLTDLQPTLIVVLGGLLDKGQSPREIARVVAQLDVFLAGIVEMAAVHMQKTGVRSINEKVKA
jgi:hypothetical protein